MNSNTLTMQEPPAMLKLGEVAEMLKVSTRTVRRLVVRGVLRPLAVSVRCLRFRRSDIVQYLDDLSRKGSEAQA
jgi:excisionase family DNA binding protein